MSPQRNLEQIHNKLKISKNVHKTIPYSILEVPKNQPWAFWEIQDGVQDDRQFHFLSNLGLNHHRNVNKASKHMFFGSGEEYNFAILLIR